MEVEKEKRNCGKWSRVAPCDAAENVTQQDMQNWIRALRQMGEMMAARFAVIEDRLLLEKSLRPLLQADKKRTNLPTASLPRQW